MVRKLEGRGSFEENGENGVKSSEVSKHRQLFPTLRLQLQDPTRQPRSLVLYHRGRLDSDLWGALRVMHAVHEHFWNFPVHLNIICS